MRDDFCMFILTHGRPDRLWTYKLLKRTGYTGRLYIVIDDEDSSRERYLELYGDQVLIFSKSEIAKRFDEADNFSDRRTIFYARNACWDLARQVGCRYFMQLDDDYNGMGFRINAAGHYGYWPYRNLNRVLDALIAFYERTPALTLAMSQGGDHIGGPLSYFGLENRTKRKAMNSFLCSVDRPFAFRGRINEDVSSYCLGGRRGEVFLTVGRTWLGQLTTQMQAGGMSEIYRDQGTYVKSMYSIMHCPSSVTIKPMGPASPRIHHRIKWNSTAVKIVREQYRKPDRAASGLAT